MELIGHLFPVMGKKKEKKEEEKNMVKNGGIVLEEVISTGNGRCNPIRIFSVEQLKNATNNFQSPFFKTEFDWFKACLNNRPVLIRTSFRDKFITSELAGRDIAITSQMSSHNRVLKLIGCCLELPVPALVYEDNECVPLNSRGYISDNGSALPWKTRLRIAKDVASVLTYLHTTFSTPIVYRNVKPSHVFLDKDFVPKLCNFSLSISIPKGETRVEDQVAGTWGFIDPEYFETSFVTEQSDVYGFGAFLLVLLTGKSLHDCLNSLTDSDSLTDFDRLIDFVQEKPWDEVVDPKILEEEGVIEEEHKLQALRNLVLRCIQTKADDRPMMIDVAKELLQIHRKVQNNHWFSTFSSQVGKLPNVPLILHKYLKEAITIDIHTKGAIVFSSFSKITPIAQDTNEMNVKNFPGKIRSSSSSFSLYVIFSFLLTMFFVYIKEVEGGMTLPTCVLRCHNPRLVSL